MLDRRTRQLHPPSRTQASNADSALPIDVTGVWTGNLHDVVSPCLDFRGATRDVPLQLKLTQTDGRVSGTLTRLPGIEQVDVQGTFEGGRLMLDEVELVTLRFAPLLADLVDGALVNTALGHQSIELAGDSSPVCSAKGELELPLDTTAPLRPALPTLFGAGALQLELGEPIDLTRAKCDVTTSSGQAVNVTGLRGLLASSVSHGFEITPVGFWDPETDYRLTARDVCDAAGNQLEDMDVALSVAPLAAVGASAGFETEEPLQAWAGKNCEAAAEYANENGQVTAPSEGARMARCDLLAGYFVPPSGAQALAFEWTPTCLQSIPRISPCITASSDLFVIRLIHHTGERSIDFDFVTGLETATFQTVRFELEPTDLKGFWLEIRSREQWSDDSGALSWLPFLADGFRFELDWADAGLR